MTSSFLLSLNSYMPCQPEIDTLRTMQIFGEWSLGMTKSKKRLIQALLILNSS